MAGSLQFVRRWVVFGRVLHQACCEICGIALLFLLLLLLFSHTGSLVFYSVTRKCYFEYNVSKTLEMTNKSDFAAWLCSFQLFSASVEGFRTVRQASQTLLGLLRNRQVLRQLSEEHPVLGPLFCITVFGLGFWIIGRLCGAVLLNKYKTVRAEMYRPSMEPQDYEMVEFFIKRLKLWMGLSKIKEV